MKRFIDTINLNDLSPMSCRFFEEFDPAAINSLFSRCSSVLEIERIVSSLYSEIFNCEV